MKHGLHVCCQGLHGPAIWQAPDLRRAQRYQCCPPHHRRAVRLLRGGIPGCRRYWIQGIATGHYTILCILILFMIQVDRGREQGQVPQRAGGAGLGAAAGPGLSLQINRLLCHSCFLLFYGQFFLVLIVNNALLHQLTCVCCNEIHSCVEHNYWTKYLKVLSW